MSPCPPATETASTSPCACAGGAGADGCRLHSTTTWAALVKDAFVLPESLNERLRGVHAAQGSTIPTPFGADLDLADARVRITDAIERRRDESSAVRDRHLAGVPPVGRVGSPRQMPRRWRRLRPTWWSEGDSTAVGRRVLRLPCSFGAALDDADLTRAAGLGDLVRCRLRTRRSAAVEPGGG